MTNVTLTITTDQAAAMTRMLDLAVRIHLCQFREIEHIARMGELKHKHGRALTMDECSDIDDVMESVSNIFGFTSNASFGIGSPHVSEDAHRGYEIKKVVEKALAEWREPNPGFKGVNYDGLLLRYTSDPAPVAEVKTEGGEG